MVIEIRRIELGNLSTSLSRLKHVVDAIEKVLRELGEEDQDLKLPPYAIIDYSDGRSTIITAIPDKNNIESAKER